MKLYKCIVDGGEEVFKTNIAAENKKDLLNEYCGNGKFEKIEDVTGDYFTDESVDKLYGDLAMNNWGDGEIKIICALLEKHIKTKKKEKGMLMN